MGEIEEYYHEHDLMFGEAFEDESGLRGFDFDPEAVAVAEAVSKQGSHIPSLLINQTLLGKYVDGVKQPLPEVPKGYWRQRNGELISVVGMGLQHLANTLRMLESNAKKGRVSGSWTVLKDEWLSRGLKIYAWHRPYFSQETYEKMLEKKNDYEKTKC